MFFLVYLMDLRKYSEDELVELQYALIAKGNLQAATEVDDFRKVYEKRVKVVNGRKVPLGTEGVVFWVKRYNYARSEWGGHDTRVGFKADNDEVFFTSIHNLEVIK